MNALDSQIEHTQPQRPIVELLYLAAPTVAQSVSYTIMQFIDIWMLSRLGTDAPTAAGNAGMLGFAVICFGWGMLLCVNTLVSQSFGRREFHECGKYFWQGVWMGLAYSLLVLPIIFLAPNFFRAMGHPSHLTHLEAIYFQIVLSTVMVKMVSTAAGQFLIGTNRPNSVFFAAMFGVSVNAIVAYGIVLGHFGFQKHGVVGAAWAQNIGVLVEMSMVLVFVFVKQREKFGVLNWRPRLNEMITLIRIGAGSGLQIVADVLAWAMFLGMVMAQLGENAMAANQFMFRYMTVGFMPAVGISQAVTALVGRYIGMQKYDVAMQRANLGFLVAAIYMFTCGAMMAIFRVQLMEVFTIDPQVIEIGKTLLLFAAVYQVFDAMYVVYNGALRGAGDTFVPAIATASMCWGINICGGYFVAHNFPFLGVAGPWSLCTVYGIVLGIFISARFRRGKWKSIHLQSNSNVLGTSAKLVVTS